MESRDVALQKSVLLSARLNSVISIATARDKA